MPENFAGDLIVFGAIALFIILRYRNTLGQNKGRDFTKPRPPAQTSDKIPVVQIQDRRPAAEAGNDNHGKQQDVMATPALTASVAEIKAIDADFTAGAFVEGAKAAYEMVITAFSNQDKDTLKMLLSKDLYKDFAKDIDEQNEKKQKRETTLVALLQSEVKEIKLNKTTAAITVLFASEQISIVRDKDGVIIEGDASTTLYMEDMWVFERDLKSRNPNWTIIDT